MRLGCVFALVFLLAGCADQDWAGIVDTSPSTDFNTFPDAGDAAPLPNGIDEQTAQKCRGVAGERSSDAGYEGFDGGIQRTVYDKVYADCLRWAVRQ